MKTEKNRSSHQTNFNCENITQQLHVEKQEFRCIINLNTTVHTKTLRHRKCSRKHRPKNSESDRKKEQESNEEEYRTKKPAKKKCKHREKHRIRKHNNYLSPTRRVIERTVPYCSRSACQHYIEPKYRESYRNKRCDENFHMKSESKDDMEYKKVKIPKVPKHHHHHNHSHHKNRHCKRIKHMESRLLSPISPSPLRDVSHTYLEDISDTSLDMYIKKKPTTYKRHFKTVTRESKLDTLIKRTKERERKLVEQSRQKHKSWNTSTPIRQKYSPADFRMSGSDMDISFNSLSTLVLEDLQNPNEDLQNPNEDLQNPNKDLQNPNEDLQNPNEDFQNPNKDSYSTAKRIKREPIPKSELQNPNKDSYFIAKGIKREIMFKSEPMFSCESPIYFDNKMEDTELKFCKTENVKSEFAC